MQNRRVSRRSAQGGFVIPQVAVAVLLLSATFSYYGYTYWKNTVRGIEDDRARLVGSTLATVNDSTKIYATEFFTQIQRNQTITRNGFTLPAARVLTPTTQDLYSLGFLPERAVNPIIFNGQSIAANIQMTVDTASGCTIPTCNLLFQVTTSAPLLIQSSGQVDVRRATIAAQAASPGNAGVSIPAQVGGDPTVFVAANGVVIGPNPAGEAGLISVRNGYDSSGMFEFDRRDGSLPRTGDINLQDTSGSKHNINNAGTVEALSSITGTLKVTGLAEEGGLCSEVGLIASSAGGKLLGCDGERWGKATDMPNAHRYLFTESTEWQVPKGVRSALVTMAGGGGSGLGWRVTSNLESGSSGGYVFSAPVNFTEGETLSITIGSGAVSYIPRLTASPSQDPRYFVVAPPFDDDGLGGYPGGTTKIVSALSGTLLECAGGSGASLNGIDNYLGDLAPGGLNGATSGSGFPSFPSPNRPADSSYATPGGPGACGPQGYGVGNKGTSRWGLSAGDTAGGMTPLGYGSGGNVFVSGCYVTVSHMSYCVFPQQGRSGVVMIDVLY